MQVARKSSCPVYRWWIPKLPRIGFLPDGGEPGQLVFGIQLRPGNVVDAKPAIADDFVKFVNARLAAILTLLGATGKVTAIRNRKDNGFEHGRITPVEWSIYENIVAILARHEENSTGHHVFFADGFKGFHRPLHFAFPGKNPAGRENDFSFYCPASKVAAGTMFFTCSDFHVLFVAFARHIVKSNIGLMVINSTGILRSIL
jgi:hypothetical protein